MRSIRLPGAANYFDLIAKSGSAIFTLRLLQTDRRKMSFG
jgi:hypothetical protein